MKVSATFVFLLKIMYFGDFSLLQHKNLAHLF